MLTEIRFAADGTPCCCEFAADGTPIPMSNPRNACAVCQAHWAAERRALGFNVAPEPDTSASADQLAAFERQLRAIDSGFVEIVSTDASRTVGKGLYLTRMAGIPEPRQKPFTFEGTTILDPQLKPAPTLDGRFTEARDEYSPPDPFTPHLATLKAATTDERTQQEADYRALREREFAAEDADLARERTARGIAEPRLVTLSDADLDAYESPDVYGEGIKALQARNARASAAREQR